RCGVGRYHHGARARRRQPEDKELDRVAQMDVELLPWLQSPPHEEVGGAVDQPVELASREPRRNGAVGVLEAEERSVRKAPRLVRESITERARADDVDAGVIEVMWRRDTAA